MRYSPLSMALVALVLLIIAWFIIRFVKYHATNAIHVPKQQLLAVQGTGRYQGEGHYGATDHFPNGLKAKLQSTRKATDSGLEVVTEVTAYDAKTGQHAYDGVRYETFSYKPNKGDRVYKHSKSYIDGELVSSSNGWVTYASDDVIETVSQGSWHISEHDHDIKCRTERNGNKLHTTFSNDTKHPLHATLYMDEVYEKIDN